MRISMLALVALAATATTTAAPAATLIAEYTFANASNIGRDSSGYNNNATTLTNVSQVAGPRPGTFAGAFNQSSKFSINRLTGHTNVPGFTFSAWVYVDGTNGGYDGILSQGSCCINRLLLENGTKIFTNIGAHNDQTLPSFVMPIRAWHQVVLTAENSGSGAIGYIYVDGVRVGSRTVGTLVNRSNLVTYLATGENGNSYRLNGNLADVRIYEGALTSSEATALYTGTLGTVPEPASWAMMLAGFGLVGFATRRRSTASVVA